MEYTPEEIQAMAEDAWVALLDDYYFRVMIGVEPEKLDGP